MRRGKALILLAASMLSLIAAVVYSYVHQSLGVISGVLGLLGLTLLILFVVVANVAANSVNSQTKRILPWKRLTLFAGAALMSILFLLSVNYVSERMPTRWDVTQYQQHTLTQASLDFVVSINIPIELTALYVGQPPKYLEDLLNEYARVSNGNISINIIDPIDDIGAAVKYGNVISGDERKLIVSAGDERNDVDFSDASLSEEQVTNALARVVREPRHVCFLTGHGERSASSGGNQNLSLFADLLSSNNISNQALMLGTQGQVPDACDVLIIAGPTSNLIPDEQALIVRYLEQGGDALFLIEEVAIVGPDTPLSVELDAKNPSLNSILTQWGIRVGDDLVVDLGSHVGGDEGSPATRNYGAHKAITEGLDYTFYIRPRSISLIADRRASIKLAPIALTANQAQSWAESDRTLNIRYDKGVDLAGPVAMSYVIWEEKQESEKSDTRIIVFTDVDFLSNAYLNQYSNAAMGLNVVNWLSELDYAVFNNRKNIEVERLDLTSKQRRVVTALLFLMPLLIILFGLLAWVRRQYP